MVKPIFIFFLVAGALTISIPVYFLLRERRLFTKLLSYLFSPLKEKIGKTIALFRTVNESGAKSY